jgi:predicted ATPase/serine phosphatase RsbU (regulator of sigma subunit)/tRNA A-37 threonylcarbamoyl transferase component Bud32
MGCSDSDQHPGARREAAMSIMTGFAITEKISEGSKSIVYRGVRESDGMPVVLKIFRQVYPSLADIARFKKEYDLIREVEIDGVIATHGLVEDKDRIALVLEDFQGISLREVMRSQKISLEEFLQIAIRIADTLGYLHSRNIIHKDIKPHNILYNSSSGAVKITDFGISTLLTREHENLYDPRMITGTLPYMSPEQTGRINKPMDYRTDLYSLGVTFYEMLTGDVPFQSEDPLEVIHWQVARKPVPPHRVNAEVPEAISDIIMKLLEKNTENRYQNAYGLKEDLEECYARLRRDGRIDRFDLGTRDVSFRFSLPQAFIGREREKEQLLEAFNRACQGGGESVVISGPPGIGKTALVYEIEKTVNEAKGFFIYSKYDAAKKNVPHSAVIHAFQQLMLRLLAEGTEQLMQWKQRILSTLGTNCQVIIDVIPELEMIVERQPALPAIDPEKSQNRFTQVFGDFVRIFMNREHPLVLFLDDVQWADSASLQFISRLIKDFSAEYFLLVMACRDNEIEPGSEFARFLSGVEGRVGRIALDNLSVEQIGEYVRYFTNMRGSEVLPLTDVIFRKTNGNPFFLINFLRSIYDNQYLRCVASEGWTWDLERIRGMQVSDNVVELMIERINALRPETRDMLKIASCIGNRFDLESIALLSGSSFDMALNDLQDAMDEGIIYQARNHYYFLHHRIHEVIYTMIPEKERGLLHYRIGHLHADAATPGELSEKIFYIVHQLNSGVACVTGRDERLGLARLNLVAGQKAKSSTAYSSANSYLDTGIGLLDADAWVRDYRLAFSLMFERAECEYLNGSPDSAIALFDALLRHANSRVDKARVYDKKIIIFTNMGNHRVGMEYGIEALKMFGIRIPLRPTRARILRGVATAAVLLGRRRVSDLLNAPEITDPEKIMIMTLCMNTGTSAYFVNNDVVAVLALTMVNLSLRYGNTPVSPFAYLSYGLILGFGMGMYRAAYSYGELALALADRYNNLDLKPRILFIFGFLVSHWQKHYSRTIDLMRESYRIGVETGDINYAVFSAINILQYRIRLGDNLDQVFEELSQYRDFVNRTRNEEFIYEFIMNERYILSLKGRTNSLADYGDQDFSEDEFREKILKYRVTKTSFALYKIMSAYHAGEFRRAYELALPHKKTIGEVLFSQTNVALYYYYYALACAALARASSGSERAAYLKKINRNVKLLARWARQCPENYLHKKLLVEAEVAGIAGRDNSAAALYDAAIREAHAGYFMDAEALSNALAAGFYHSRGSERITRAYLMEARYCYTRIGSIAQAQRLVELYPQYLGGEVQREAAETSIDQTSSSSGTKALDFKTLLKTTSIISGEIVLEKLLKKLVIVIGECAAATKGALILEKDGKFVIEASGDITADHISVLQGTPIDASNELSPAIVNYVARTRECLVLDDASGSGLFVNDPYIKKNRCKSVLCIPVVYQAKLTALLYAENNLAEHVFTDERIELLKTLASYVAVSVDNARLYANLEDKVKERTMELAYAYEKINDAYRTIQEDIGLARRIQESILTSQVEYESRFRVKVHFHPMSEVGGDIYDIVEIRPGILRVFIADATGHGIQAALVTMLIKSEYEKIKLQHIPPSELLGILNNQFINQYRNLLVLFSCIIIDIDINAGQVRYASAGHPDQYLIHGNDVAVIGRTGKIVGFVRDLTYGLGEIAFAAGDKVILFSDGVYEEFDMDMKEYGEKRLIDVLKNRSREPVEVITRSIIQDVRNFIGKERINASDDVTIIGVETV